MPIVRRSAPCGHVPWLLGALIYAGAKLLGRGWAEVLPWGHGPWMAALLDLASAALLGAGLGRIGGLRRLLTPRRDRFVAVHRAAEVAFHRLNLHRARGEAGVLLFVSLEERRAVVLAGKGISDLAQPGHWDETCRLLLDGAARHDLGSGVAAAVEKAAEVLALHHPHDPSTPRPELKGRLHLLHDGF